MSVETRGQDAAAPAGPPPAPSPPGPPAEPPPGRSGGGPRPRRRWPWVATGVAVVAAVAVGLGLFLRPPAAPAGDEATAVERETAEVHRGDLTQEVRQKGTLRFADPRSLGTVIEGTITGLPAAGTVIGRGAELLRVDDLPVVLLLGDLPMWRPFESGMADGRDVLQLETNLAELGFFDRTPDEEFTWRTRDAIRRWQKSLGLERTGSIELGRIVFEPSDVRVGSAAAAIGDPASPEALDVTGTAKEIVASVDPNLAAVAVPGAATSVSLPDGTRAEATIESVGSPREEEDGSGGKDLKIPLVLRLDDPSQGEALDNVGVTLQLSRVIREDALLVPVLALLAAPEGGFAVQVLDGGAVRDVPIEIGAFAGSMVEVTGGELAEGDEVVVGR
ncbi:MAG: hypothetical protein BGO96_13615 [Micrococcales bacterium 73-15]|nr:MAG: hypothetical protein BGO96_13615 [Micrococcales bacterium 73-15]